MRTSSLYCARKSDLIFAHHPSLLPYRRPPPKPVVSSDDQEERERVSERGGERERERERERVQLTAAGRSQRDTHSGVLSSSRLCVVINLGNSNIFDELV
ncbi:hypothetical protein JOB18_035175 [Solea senegalensis]|uniref:Uncharacterized protein n=1 Tax=Solea senegalensis TaxID=28829 RepID=A0AAV6RF03_SOLSE|nr:hypothetical protein JOB18_035175 [Solea senegalensis]